MAGLQLREAAKKEERRSSGLVGTQLPVVAPEGGPYERLTVAGGLGARATKEPRTERPRSRQIMQMGPVESSLGPIAGVRKLST